MQMSSRRKLPIILACLLIACGGAGAYWRHRHKLEEKLLEASLQGNAETVQQMLRAGISPNVRDARGRSALMLAVESDNETAKTVDALIRAGADLEAKDPRGNTALSLALESGAPQIIDTLIKHSRDPAGARAQFHPTVMAAGKDWIPFQADLDIEPGSALDLS